jgi:putative ABC transport system permease protein
MNSLKIIFDLDTWQEIFDSISKNRTRTIITIIGVLWGIFIYIALAGAAKGLDNGFERTFRNIAMNSIGFWAQRTSLPYAGFKKGRNPRLTIHDAEVLKERIPGIQFITPRNVRGVFGGGGPPLVVRNSKSETYALYGDTPEYARIVSKKIYDGGRFINEKDVELERKVCVIGERTVKELFDPNEDPIGEYIKINQTYFQVIGIHKFVQGGGFESDGDIFIPFTTYNTMYNNGDNVNFFFLAAYDSEDPVKIEAQIESVLQRIHNVSQKDDEAFGFINLGEIFGKIIGFSKGLTFLSLVVGLATIIAGVIGIGNILLISVKERTKELGIRRALGATPAEVKTQIILESVFLTFIAGVLGIILGAIVLAGINAATVNMTDFPYTNPTVPIPYILGVLFIIVTLGTLIGLIPAQKAVSIKPIEALREE